MDRGWHVLWFRGANMTETELNCLIITITEVCWFDYISHLNVNFLICIFQRHSKFIFLPSVPVLMVLLNIEFAIHVHLGFHSWPPPLLCKGFLTTDHRRTGLFYSSQLRSYSWNFYPIYVLCMLFLQDHSLKLSWAILWGAMVKVYPTRKHVIVYLE